MGHGAPSELGQLPKAGDMVVGAGHEHRAGGRAGGGHMIVGEPESVGFGSKSVDVGCLDLRTETSAVAEPEIVGDDDEKVRTWVL